MQILKNKRVVVTGIGPLSAIGIGNDELWEGIIERENGVVLEKRLLEGENLEDYFIYKIKNFDIKNFGIDDYALEEIKIWKNGAESVDLYYLLAAVKLAIDDSKLQVAGRFDTGFVLAHENPGLERFYSEVLDNSFRLFKDKPDLTKKEYFERLYSLCSKSAYELQTFMFLYHVAKTFNIHGFSLFVNNACASGLYALETASQIIKSGRNSVIIVAAVDYPDMYRNYWLRDIGLYAEDGIIKPFAVNRNGFICGQGGAALVLEDLEHAKQRNAYIYAEYLGGGYSLESWKVTVPNVGQDIYKNTLAQALKYSDIRPDEIDLINAHGVATNIMDQYEAAAIRAVFGEETQPPVSAFKPYVGHNLGGCALLETAMLLLAMEHNIVPPVLNCAQVDRKLKINVVKESMKCTIKTSVKMCSSFAGFDAAAVFRKI